MKFKLETCNKPKAEHEICQLLKLNSLAEIIRAWVSDKRSLVVISGKDDKTSEAQVYLLFEDKTFKYPGNEVACAFCNQSEITADLPEIHEFIPPPFTSHAFDCEIACIEDQQFYEKQKKLLKYEWNDFLQSDVCTTDSAAKAAVGLALSAHGETTFTKASMEWLDDHDELDEDPAIYREHFIWANSRRGHENGNIFECSDYYMDLRI